MAATWLESRALRAISKVDCSLAAKLGAASVGSTSHDESDNDVERVYGECADRDVVRSSPFARHPPVKAGGEPDHLSTWRVAVRRVRSQARRSELALPNRRMSPREPVDQGGPPPPAGPA